MLRIIEAALWVFLISAVACLTVSPLFLAIGKKQVPPVVKGK